MTPPDTIRPMDSIDFASALTHERTRIVRFCTRFTGSVDAAEDLAQETLLEAWRNASKLRDIEGMGPWLTAIAHNVCLRWREREHRPLILHTTALHSELDESVRDDWDLEVVLERRELADLLDRALGQLPPPTRATLIEKYIYERPQSEIAKRLGMSVGAIELRLHRGKLALRRLLTTTLRDEAVGYGLCHGLQEKWNETRIWCPYCGRYRLRAHLEEGHRAFLLHCPECSRDGLPLAHWADPTVISALKGYKPMLTRLSALDHIYYRQGLQDGTAHCRTCGTLTQVERGVPDNLTTLFGTTRGLVIRCRACRVIRFFSSEALVCSLPEFQRFWRAHPRLRRLAPQQVEAQGRIATITRVESLTDTAALRVVWAHDTYDVLHISG